MLKIELSKLSRKELAEEGFNELSSKHKFYYCYEVITSEERMIMPVFSTSYEELLKDLRFYMFDFLPKYNDAIYKELFNNSEIEK